MNLTGNPFVDTGLAVLASLAKKKSVDDLNVTDIRKIHGNGELLSRWNSRLKCTSMIFTLNSIITNPAIKDYEKRILYYSKMTTAILENFDSHDINEICESCGNSYSLDINRVIKNVLVPLGYHDGTKYIGRDWFPLAGSLKSDAQALPSGSRSPNLCAKCLFVVHYLPLGVILVDRRLTLFQSTSKEFWYDLIDGLATEIYERVSAGNYETLGSKEGSVAAIKRLLQVMKRMTEDVQPGTSLFIWKFSNSGIGPDCKFEEIPNPALQFLRFSVKYDLKEEIMTLILKDKNLRSSFLKCISTAQDYYSLYPFKNFNGVSQKLFFLYQTIIRKIATANLMTAYTISLQLKSITNPKEFEDIGKDLDNNFAKQNFVRKIIVKMIEDKMISFESCYQLFTYQSNNIQINFDAWKFIKYYMHHTEEDFFSIDKLQYIEEQRVDSRLDILVKIGKAIYDSYLEEKGIERFRKEVLDHFGIGRINSKWFKNQFVRLSERLDIFTWELWKLLCIDDKGKESVYNVLYLLRLLWTEWINKGASPEVQISSVFPEEVKNLDTDIAAKDLKSIIHMGRNYMDKIGPVRYQRDILQDLRKGNKGVYWIRAKLSKTDDKFEDHNYWESFLTDRSGNNIKSIRIFQIQLVLANIYREHIFKQEMKKI